MTRATLLRLLAHPTALNGADVRALEELAEAFPYCQTAHLLLAKAAHDQGSMLAGQRLRRAATYAADRTLLRQLVEAPPVEELAAAGPAPSEYAGSQGEAYTAGELESLAPAEATELAPAALLLEDNPAQEIIPAFSFPASPEAATETLAAPAQAAPATPVEPVPTPALAELPPLAPPAVETVSAADDTAASTDAAAPAPVATGTAPAVAAPALSTPATDLPAELPVADDLVAAPVAPAPELRSETDVPLAAPAQLDAPAPEEAPASESAATIGSDQPALGQEPPPQAPPIRPPTEAEAARQEFGLSPTEPTEIVSYQLPELELAITVPLTPADATPRLPPFGGVADVAYAPSEGSRYGYCLVPAAPPASEAVPSLIPGTTLPPPGEFFVPDALMLAHVATQPVAASSSTTDLINSFLLRTPSNMRRRAQPVAKTSEQADLSIRSTRAAPDLASESLARILTQQGKIEQAIAIYERLMVKNPEKMAYFAVQIDLLRP